MIALKNAYHKFLKEGIAPIAASGEFGAPLGASGASASTTGCIIGDDRRIGDRFDNIADNSTVGDSNGMSLPAVLDEVISVTGVFSFPYDQTPASPPTDGPTAVLSRTTGPVLLLGNSAHARRNGQHRTARAAPAGLATATGFDANAQLLAAADFEIYANRILGSVNRSNVDRLRGPGDQCPDIPAQASLRTATGTSSTTGGSVATNTNHLTFNQSGRRCRRRS